MKRINVKFKHKVLPGDTLIFKCDLITPMKVCHIQANAYANGKLVARQINSTDCKKKTIIFVDSVSRFFDQLNS
jgi:3-hydroxymyristoyl/3-hydroxydecanoyl-(acyl carrier protein) dehydratase